MTLISVLAAALVATAAPAVAAGPADTIAAITAAWAHGDAAAVARQFVPDADFVAVDGSVFAGTAQIGQVFAALFADRYAGSTVDLRLVNSQSIAPDVTALRGDFTVAKAGTPLDCGHFFAVLRARGGAWRVANYHETGAKCP